uniref:Ubiquinone biosynthesis protein COQ4 homolog, mitochondrial n=1 Tax=Oryza nivara TaxID=4536 RepID=A0A0E0HAL4_ORYNI
MFLVGLCGLSKSLSQASPTLVGRIVFREVVRPITDWPIILQLGHSELRIHGRRAQLYAGGGDGEDHVTCGSARRQRRSISSLPPHDSEAQPSGERERSTARVMQGARVNLKGWQQAAVAFGSAFGALLDPRRADLIATLGETTGKPAFHRVLQRMRNSAEGRDVLLERPRVISTQVSHAWDMPQNTFGAAYAQFMGSRNFSPDDRPPVRFIDTDELAYVATRACEVHDFWHVLFGLPTNLIGETALKVIEFEQMFLPMCMLSVVGGSARFNEKQRTLFFQHYFPWLQKLVLSAQILCLCTMRSIFMKIWRK